MKIKDDLAVLLLAELTEHLGVLGDHEKRRIGYMASEVNAINTMLEAGQLTPQQAILHGQIRINALQMELLAQTGIDDMAVARMLAGLEKVVRRFYGV